MPFATCVVGPLLLATRFVVDTAVAARVGRTVRLFGATVVPFGAAIAARIVTIGRIGLLIRWVVAHVRSPVRRPHDYRRAGTAIREG